MNKVKVTSVTAEKNTVNISYSVSGSDTFNSYFVEKELRINYFMNVSDVPEGILVIPLVCNVLPIIWLFDAELEVNELDKAFYDSIEDFKNGYRNMYPYFKFLGKLNIGSITENTHNSSKSAVLFSGGVDAFTTLIRHIDEKPELITLWGADIAVDNQNGWNMVDKQLKETCKVLDLKNYIVQTSFRTFISEPELKKYIIAVNPKLGWWHDFQHGIGIISHAAPITYKLGIGKLYIASSFTKNDIGNYTCASDPTIDNFVRFGSTKVIHDGYELNRQMKVHQIGSFCEKTKVKLPIRVCWESTGGRNCCECEKCYRTIMGILADRKDPADFGFSRYNSKVRRKMLFKLRFDRIPKYNYFRYSYIQNALRENYKPEECPKDLKWFYDLEIRKEYTFGDKMFFKLKSYYIRGKYKIINCLRKIGG